MDLVLNTATCSGTGCPVGECQCEQHRSGRERKSGGGGSLVPPTINFEELSPLTNPRPASQPGPSKGSGSLPPQDPGWDSFYGAAAHPALRGALTANAPPSPEMSGDNSEAIPLPPTAQAMREGR